MNHPHKALPEGNVMVSRRLPLEQPLLGFLMQGPLHGYDLHRRVRQELGQVWYVGISHVYGALKQLEQAGLVECVSASRGNRRARRVYRIRPAGREQFRAWVQQQDDKPQPSLALRFPC